MDKWGIRKGLEGVLEELEKENKRLEQSSRIVELEGLVRKPAIASPFIHLLTTGEPF